MMFFEMAVVLADTDIQTAIRDQPLANEWILRSGVHRDELIVTGVIGKVKARHPFQRFKCRLRGRGPNSGAGRATRLAAATNESRRRED